MKKFLDRFEDKSVSDLTLAFPEYKELFEEIKVLESEATNKASNQVKQEYLSLVDSLDNFLFREENLIKLGVLERLKVAETISSEIAKKTLEEEIEELTKTIDKSIIQQQVQRDIDEKSKSSVDLSELKEITRDMIDLDNQYYGLKFERKDMSEYAFYRVLSVLNIGIKYYNGSSSSKHYVMIKLTDEDRLILQVDEPIVNYKRIFYSSSKPLEVFILSKKQNKVENLYKMLEMTFGENRSYFDTKSMINDNELFNKPLFIGAYQEGYFYEEAELLLQPDFLLQRQSLIKQNFNLHFPLEYILTLRYCEYIYDTQSREGKLTYEEIAAKIKKAVDEKEYRIERIGDVPHTKDVLEKLKNLNYIDENYNLTTIGKSVSLYQSKTFTLNPKFNPTSYYYADIKNTFGNSKTKYYSDFNGTIVYHTGNTISNIEYAIFLNTQIQNDFDFQKAEQKDAFPSAWQAKQSFNSYIEYKPFAAQSNLKFYPRTSEQGKRGLENKLNFKNDDMYDLFFTSPTTKYDYALNSSVYNAIIKIHSDKKIKVMGPDYGAKDNNKPLYFMIMDDKNNLLAIIKPLYSIIRNKIDDSEEQLDMFQQNIYISLPSNRAPEPIWDFDNVYEEISNSAPEIIAKGVITDDIGDLSKDSDVEPAIEETTIQEEDDFISADVYDAKKAGTYVEEEKEEENEDLQNEIELLEETLEVLPEDEEVKEELERKREELLNSQKEEAIIEEKIELEDDDFDLDIDLDDFTEEEPIGEEEVEKILDEQIKPIKQRQEEEEKELDLDDIDFDI